MLFSENHKCLKNLIFLSIIKCLTFSLPRPSKTALTDSVKLYCIVYNAVVVLYVVFIELYIT